MRMHNMSVVGFHMRRLFRGCSVLVLRLLQTLSPSLLLWSSYRCMVWCELGGQLLPLPAKANDLSMISELF
jgi:hypothetical protein